MTLWLTLTDALGFLGVAGTVIALTSALVAAIAFSIGSPYTGWIAAVGWLAGVLLALCNGFTANWTLFILALISLPVTMALTVIVAVLRSIPGPQATAGSSLISRPVKEPTDA